MQIRPTPLRIQSKSCRSAGSALLSFQLQKSGAEARISGRCSTLIPAYINKRTGLEQYEDPRLERLVLPSEWEPIKWEWTRDDSAQCSKFRNKNTGEVINSDPQLFPEALRVRGVLVERTSLV
jgi:hypothetical protein